MNNKPSLLLPTSFGYSLIEAIIALGLLTILTGIVVAFMIALNRTAFFFTDQSTAITTADKTISLLSKQLRETTDGDNGSFALGETTMYKLGFYSDIDKDNETEYITYQLNGTTLERTIIEPTGVPAQYLSSNAQTTVVADHIVNQTYSNTAIFTYYDTQNNLLATPVELGVVTLVSIRVDVNVNPNNIPDTHIITTDVQLRNLNDNL